MAKYEYTLGALGERLKVEETEGDSSRTVEYEYDDVYRLVSEKVTDERGTTVTSYTYDKNSNRLTKTVGEDVTEYSYNELNQLISETGIKYSYDLNGNLISKTELGKNTTYSYNARNRLVRVTVQNGADVNVEEYLYDYAGNRTAKIQEFKTTYYLVDTNGALSQVLAEYDENGSLTTLYTRGSELISQERNGEKSYYLYDGFDSVRMLANDECEITDTYTYDAFGNLISSTGNTVNDFLYRGEQFDSFTGLYYLRARYMNPSTGTFITMDEYAGSIFEPVSLHKYLYANANPVTYCDPSGYFSLSDSTTSIAIMGVLNSIVTAELYLINFFSTAAPNQAFDWGSFWLSVFVGGFFGAVGEYALIAESAIVMGALGFSSLASAAMSGYQSVYYGQQGEYELAFQYWLCTAVGLVGGALALRQAYMFHTAKATTVTVTDNSVENNNVANKLDLSNLKETGSSLKGKTPEEISAILKNSGYETNIRTSTKSKSGAVIIEITNCGGKNNIAQIQISPGGGRHGPNPYIKISTTDKGKFKFVYGDPSTYKSDGNENATIIFVDGR